MIEGTIFAVFASLAILAALGVVLNRSMVYSALCLITVFFSIAALFVLNNADFLAVAQVLVYAVGLTIVLLFGLMFTGEQQFSPSFSRKRRAWMGAIVGVLLVKVLGLALILSPMASTPMAPEQVAQLQRFGTTPQIGQLLFTKYVLPFEVVSLLLLGAMIGAIVLSKKSFEAGEAGVKFRLSATQPPPEAQAWRASVGFAQTVEPTSATTDAQRMEASPPLSHDDPQESEDPPMAGAHRA